MLRPQGSSFWAPVIAYEFYRSRSFKVIDFQLMAKQIVEYENDCLEYSRAGTVLRWGKGTANFAKPRPFPQYMT